MGARQGLNSLLHIDKSDSMSEKSKESVKKHSDKLAKLGMEIRGIQFSYKVEEKTDKEYWERRIDDFQKYNKKSLEYYNQVHAMISTVNREESQMFLIRISKFHQLSIALTGTMRKIKENPSIINSRDKQQSLWSKEIKDQLTTQSNECLRHEMDMNAKFRELYDKELKKLLE